MEITIRKAVREDCPRLLELVQELATFERNPDAVTVSLDHFRESGFGEKPVWWALVAETSRLNPPSPPQERNSLEVVGFALYYIRYSTWKGQAMYLEDILVTHEMRGKGIGKMLFENLIREAREKKFKRVVWQVLDWNESAIQFYKKYDAAIDRGWLNCSIDV